MPISVVAGPGGAATAAGPKSATPATVTAAINVRFLIKIYSWN
jgi:hypothetical protein